MTNLSLLVSLPTDGQPLELLAQQLEWDKPRIEMASALFERGLPPLVDTHTLPYLFGVRSKFVAAMANRPKKYYRTFGIDKRGGGTREIESPRRTLKVIQGWVNQHILSGIELPDCVTGFVRGRNIFDNARPHVTGRNLMVVDIENFFPSVKKESIRGVFREIGFPDSTQVQLASLCAFEDRLPQGAPTSPAIANAVFRAADTELRALADSWECHYSRYADDLAFSGERTFSPVDVSTVGNIISNHGFPINRAKTRRIGAGGRQIVTGLVVNQSALPPRWKRRNWRAMFHTASKHPERFADREKRLRGVAAFVKQYNPDRAAEYQAIADEVRRITAETNGSVT